jgi:hypothetical protein
VIHKSGIINGERVYQTPFLRPDLLDHATDLRFTISSHNVWLPGVYDSEGAARYAFRFRDEDLDALQEQANAAAGGTGGVITFEMLRQTRKTDARRQTP